MWTDKDERQTDSYIKTYAVGGLKKKKQKRSLYRKFLLRSVHKFKKKRKKKKKT